LPMQPPTNSQTRRYSVKELQRVLFSKLLTRPTPNEHKCLEKHRYSGFETWYTRFRLDVNLRQRLRGQKLLNLDAEYTNGKPHALSFQWWCVCHRRKSDEAWKIYFVLSEKSLKIRDDGTGVMRPLRMGEIQGSIPCHSILFLLESGVSLILGEFLKFGG
jgi:hypothetical protein